ncbi:ribosome biogenesis protein Nop16 [Xylariomycetidae sp. FL0641]|nr:ribosome biogenesis protein Nop16 [Xylariomycetidae sp. FL0641]
MGRELQKRKRRSSRPTIRQHSSAHPKRLQNPLGNDLVAKNWNKNETTTQNYRRLGLVSRLRAPTGGVEPDRQKLAAAAAAGNVSSVAGSQAGAGRRAKKAADPFAIDAGTGAVVSEARVERDASGRIVRVLSSSSSSRANPLNDPLAALDSDNSDNEDDGDDGEEWGGIQADNEDEDDDENAIIRQLEEEASRPVEKKPRTQSGREVEWLERLVEKYGDDTRAMARDRKLNPMQQTEADISRRIRKWKGESS